MNGDRVADLVTLTLSGRSILRQRSLYEVHFGTPTPCGIRFAREVSTAIRPGGKAGGMQPWGYASQWFEDLDGNGQVDVLLRDVAGQPQRVAVSLPDDGRNIWLADLNRDGKQDLLVYHAPSSEPHRLTMLIAR